MPKTLSRRFYHELTLDQNEQCESLSSNYINDFRRSKYTVIVFKSCLILGLWLLLGYPLWLYSQAKYGLGTLTDKPLAHTRNGTYAGIYDQKHDQYQFLGMPYAMSPIGSLRFRPPQAIDTSWQDIRPAHAMGPICTGYKDNLEVYPQSEDCLTINVVRPVSTSHDSLPVGVYIYGGGGHGGGSRDGRYNMSFIVDHAARNGLPFIAVTFNYRASVWGFLAGREVSGTGNTNLGLMDQRLALHWIQENIGAFGGDPGKVTIWGGSSGAEDVGLHLTAYGGRDDGLFRAAIMQSGTSMAATRLKQASAQAAMNHLLTSTSCANSDDPIDCLRYLPFEQLNQVFDDGSGGLSGKMLPLSLPSIDGNFINNYPSLSIKDSKFVKVPILIGTVSDEGFSWITEELQRRGDLGAFLQESSWKLPPAVVDRLLSFYPHPKTGEHEVLHPPIKGMTDGDLFDRGNQVLGDLSMTAARRLMCDAFARVSTCYSYRWDAVARLASQNPREGVQHSSEIGPVFQNVDGLGFLHNPFKHRERGYFEMTRAVGLMWAGFITHLNPNAAFDGQEPWPSSEINMPQNIVFNETGPYWVEPDTWRRDATDYIRSILHTHLER